MIWKLAFRTLGARPVRSAVLACGFGLGVSVMATLLGVGEVILAQARAPTLRGGGDVIVAGSSGPLVSARYLLGIVLGTSPLKERVVVASPTAHKSLYLAKGGRSVLVRATGGVPSLERRLSDPETSQIPGWVDEGRDAEWVSLGPSDAVRSMDRIHPIPDAPGRAGSWAEWLYFNGHAGDTRFYLTFLIGPQKTNGRRSAGVRLQLDRAGQHSSYVGAQDIEEASLAHGGPDLSIGPNRVRLEGLRYRLTLDLKSQEAPARVSGELSLEAIPARSIPPLTIRGAGGWLSGYVVPVTAGRLEGHLFVNGERLSFDNGSGYHDHNWGFWEGVTWQWGEVQDGGRSFVYGRIHPPADAADPERIPGIVAILGPEGLLGYAADVSIREAVDLRTGRPKSVSVEGRGQGVDLTMELSVDDAFVTRIGKDPRNGTPGTEFWQLRARYRVKGRAGGRQIDFSALGSAETFRGR